MVPAFALLSVIAWLIAMCVVVTADIEFGDLMFWACLCMFGFSIYILWGHVAV